MRPSEALAAHRDELRQLVSRYDLSRPRVFGSVVSGTDTDQSDLDLLVDATETTTLFTLARLQHAAQELLGVPVSVLTPESLPAKFRDRVPETGRAAMKHPERVEDYLEHIAQAIQRATEYVEHVGSVDAFQQSQRDQDAVIRNIEIIGEAATLIQRHAPEFVTAHPELPWIDMRGMRNKMIHALL